MHLCLTFPRNSDLSPVAISASSVVSFGVIEYVLASPYNMNRKLKIPSRGEMRAIVQVRELEKLDIIEEILLWNRRGPGPF